MKQYFLPLILADANGLKSSIRKYDFGQNLELAFAPSLLISDQFKEGYGENVSNAQYEETFYMNVLKRNYDKHGYNYLMKNINPSTNTSFELLLGFAASTYNKDLVAKITSWAI